jgi:hypothetical protein
MKEIKIIKIIVESGKIAAIDHRRFVDIKKLNFF